ncbi:hypothetical protein [Gluconobacter oxydans]|nr:hypothetical protein [Gluconobacter oxydans]
MTKAGPPCKGAVRYHSFTHPSHTLQAGVARGVGPVVDVTL